MKKQKFRFLDITTADVAFEAYGKTLNKVFANSALALFEIMVNTSHVEPKRKKKLEIRGHDIKSLFFNWLSELIFLSDSEHMVFSKFSVKIDQETLVLKAECYGEKIKPRKHELRTEVKAATYHKMKVEKTTAGWISQAIVDI
jgi:SHS2 domain-containing protein